MREGINLGISNQEKWNPFSVDEVRKLFKTVPEKFYISGGLAIDLFLGYKTREHEDIDISIRRSDQNLFQNILASWDLRASDPPGSGVLRTWKSQEFLE